MLPWLQEAKQRNPDAVGHLFNCDGCKGRFSAKVRQGMGCGWEPAVAHAQPWDHPGREAKPDERDENNKLRLPVCPGYAITHSEVIEASWANSYWEKGSLDQFCEGQSTPQLRDAMHVYAVEQAAAREWADRNREKK